jgi:membrane protein DedA with SNARE-associated domain
MSENKSAFTFGERQEADSIPDLLRQLVDQGGQLAQQQLDLIQAEVKASVSDVGQAMGAMAGAAVVAVAGLGVLLMGCAFLLGQFMDLWLATMIVAAAAMGASGLLYLAGRRKMARSKLELEGTRRTLERAPRALAGRGTHTG